MKIQTKKGYGFFEASSAFQKSIRRNEEKAALYFMTEFFNSGYDEYLWKRIKIIASEDIGLADPLMPVLIASLYQSFADLKKDNKETKPERIFLVHAVIALCRAKKSRLIDYAVIVSWRSHEETHLEIPDYAHDKHTLTGKQLGRGVDHFFTEGAFCENLDLQPGENEMRETALALVKKNPVKLKFETRKKGTLSQQHMNFDPE